MGGSKFYEVVDGEGDTCSPTEKQDHMKPIESDDEGDQILELNNAYICSHRSIST